MDRTNKLGQRGQIIGLLGHQRQRVGQVDIDPDASARCQDPLVHNAVEAIGQAAAQRKDRELRRPAKGDHRAERRLLGRAVVLKAIRQAGDAQTAAERVSIQQLLSIGDVQIGSLDHAKQHGHKILVCEHLNLILMIEHWFEHYNTAGDGLQVANRRGCEEQWFPIPMWEWSRNFTSERGSHACRPSATGSVKVKVLPLSAPSLSAQMLPPWTSMISLQIASPSPVPRML